MFVKAGVSVIGDQRLVLLRAASSRLLGLVINRAGLAESSWQRGGA